MAVQAHHHPSSDSSFLADLHHTIRPVQIPHLDLCNVDPRSLLLSFPFSAPDASCPPMLHHHQSMIPPCSTPFPSLAFFQQQQQTQQPPVVVETGPRQRKKRKGPIERKTHYHSAELNQGHACPPAAVAANGVSTGLRLALEDERSTVTSSRLDVGSMAAASALTLADGISAKLAHQNDEFNQLFQTQVEQLRHALFEKVQSDAKFFLEAMEEQVSLKIRDREIELERVNRRNQELEQRIKQIGLETHIWQNKAKSFETMVAVLRANLQQALVNQTKEQILMEGHGDNEADDAASAHVDDTEEAQKSRVLNTKNAGALVEETIRACKGCKSMEACILLVPCMHLCLCRHCQKDVEKCPICKSITSACVEVYLS